MKKEFDLTAVKEFISEEMTPKELSNVLDDACFNLAKYATTSDRDQQYWGMVDEQIDYLRTLRDMFSAME